MVALIGESFFRLRRKGLVCARLGCFAWLRLKLLRRRLLGFGANCVRAERSRVEGKARRRRHTGRDDCQGRREDSYGYS